MVALASLAEDRCSRTDPRVLKAAIDRRLDALLPPDPRSGDLGAALRYAVLAPGKRIRPMLTVLAAWEIGPADLRALDAGCAIEMVHAASLILDDMPAMDDARERRGQPATHVKFGEDVAMLCAITLLSRATAILAAMHHLDGATRCTLIAMLADAVGTQGLAGGQYSDLRPHGRFNSTAVAEANHKKTGALFTAAFGMAGAILGIDDPAARSLQGCALHLGQAYQMLDDFLDSTALSRPDRLEDAGKPTLLALLGQEAAQAQLRRHIDGALAALRPDGALARYIGSLFGEQRAMPELVR